MRLKTPIGFNANKSVKSNRELTLKRTDEMLLSLDAVGPLRMTKQLPSGNIAILQVADPNAVPTTAKMLRLVPGKVGKFLTSIEAAFRVGRIVYNNSMRGPQKRRGKSKSDRGANVK